MTPIETEVCAHHSGLTTDISNIKGDVGEIRIDISLIKNRLLNRMPNWGTLVITLMAATIGGLLTAVIQLAQILSTH